MEGNTDQDLNEQVFNNLCGNKYSIASRIYNNEFKDVTFIIFNSETGEMKKKEFKNFR